MSAIVDKQMMRIKKAHLALMKHPETALYSGVMLMGKSDVVEGSFTAYTDGVNKKYCADYLASEKEDAVIRGVVLHENLHVALKHIARCRDMYEHNRRLAGLAVDFVVNDVIANVNGTILGGKEPIVKLGEGWVYDEMFHNWSVRQVWDYLKKHAKKSPQPQQGQPQGGCGGDEQEDSGKNSPPDGKGEKYESVEVNGEEYDLSGSGDGGFDEHDWDSYMDGLTEDELKELGKKIDDGLRQGGILAGRMGGKIPRTITDMLEPKVDWKEHLREFVSSSRSGSDEFTWRKMNRRQLANDMYVPSLEAETMGDVIMAIDTSGSIGADELNLFASELASICDLMSPSGVRIIWWDGAVAGEQYFNDDYANLSSRLEPKGGGGTYLSCVSKYVINKGYEADCIVVLTDGYTENDIKWDTPIPTLFTIVHGNKSFTAPTGKVIITDDLS